SWQITEGTYEGRYVFQRITFMHSSIEATTIGRRQFKDLCVATGVGEQVTDVTVFKYIPCQIRVGIEQDKTGLYDDKNRVSRIWHVDAQVKQPSQPAQPVKSSASATTTTSAATATAPPAAAAQPTATQQGTGNAASGANGNGPPGRHARPPPAREQYG